MSSAFGASVGGVAVEGRDGVSEVVVSSDCGKYDGAEGVSIGFEGELECLHEVPLICVKPCMLA